MANDNNATGSVLLAFLLGAAAGAAVALLYAPASGVETRRKLAAKAREGRDKVEEFVDRHRDDISSAVERGRETFDKVRKEFA